MNIIRPLSQPQHSRVRRVLPLSAALAAILLTGGSHTRSCHADDLATLREVADVSRAQSARQQDAKLREILARQKDDRLKLYLKGERIYVNGKQVTTPELLTIIRVSELKTARITSDLGVRPQRESEIKSLLEEAGIKKVETASMPSDLGDVVTVARQQSRQLHTDKLRVIASRHKDDALKVYLKDATGIYVNGKSVTQNELSELGRELGLEQAVMTSAANGQGPTSPSPTAETESEISKAAGDGVDEPSAENNVRNAEVVAAIQWVKSVDGQLRRKKMPAAPGKKRQRGPVESVGLRRGAGSDPDAVRVNDEGLKHLAAFPQLRKLDLGMSPQVTKNGVKALAELPTLVDLSYSPGNAACVQALAHLTNLRRLNLFQGKVNDSDLVFLSGLPLQKLCLSYTAVSDDGLKHVAALSKLDALHLEKTTVSDAGMKHLATMESLRTLDLSETQVTKSGLEELTRLNQLQVLSLDGLGFGDDEVEVLSAFKGLEMLGLYDNPVTDTGMKTLGQLKELRRLSLVSTKVSDEGLRWLAMCSKLEMVDLYDTDVTGEGIAELRKALPNCVVTTSYSYGEIPDLKITRDEEGVMLQASEDSWP